MTSSRTVRLLGFASAANNFRFYWAFATIYLAAQLGSYAGALALLALAELTRAVLEVPSGVISDRLGRVPTLCLGLAASALSVLGLAIGLPLALVGWALGDGIARAMFSGNNESLVHDALASEGLVERYPSALGGVNARVELSGFMAIMIGSAAVGVPLVVLVWASLVPTVGALLIGLRIAEPARSAEHRLTMVAHVRAVGIVLRHNLRLRYLIIGSIWDAGIGEVMWALRAPAYALFLPLWLVGMLISTAFLSSAVGFHLAGRLMHRLGPLAVLIGGQMVTRVLMIGGTIVASIASPWLIAASGISYGPASIADSTIFQAELHRSIRATVLSVRSLGASIAFVLIAPFFGLLADNYGVLGSLLIGQLCALPVLFFYMRLRRLYAVAPGI